MTYAQVFGKAPAVGMEQQMFKAQYIYFISMQVISVLLLLLLFITLAYFPVLCGCYCCYSLSPWHSFQPCAAATLSAAIPSHLGLVVSCPFVRLVSSKPKWSVPERLFFDGQPLRRGLGELGSLGCKGLVCWRVRKPIGIRGDL